MREATFAVDLIAEIHSEHEQKKKLMSAQLKVESLHCNFSLKFRLRDYHGIGAAEKKKKYPEGVDICIKIVLS